MARDTFVHGHLCVNSMQFIQSALSVLGSEFMFISCILFRIAAFIVGELVTAWIFPLFVIVVRSGRAEFIDFVILAATSLPQQSSSTARFTLVLALFSISFGSVANCQVEELLVVDVLVPNSLVVLDVSGQVFIHVVIIRLIEGRYSRKLVNRSPRTRRDPDSRTGTPLSDFFS